MLSPSNLPLRFCRSIASQFARTLRAPVALLLILCLLGASIASSARANVSSQKTSNDKSKKQTRKTKKNKQREREERAERKRGKKRDAREAFDEGREEGEEGEDPDARLNWFFYQRMYPTMTLPVEARRRAWEARPLGEYEKGGKGRVSPLAASQVWRSIGPAPVTSFFNEFWGASSGRINVVAIAPNNPNLILVGGATGGIWRSADGGATFVPTSDDQVDLAVGSIAFAKSNPQIVYAGMGDVYGPYVGTGVLKSTDGGQTWTRVSNSTLPAPGTIVKVDVDPNNPNRVYAAQFNYPDVSTGGNFASGFFVSNDGGANWTKTLSGLPRDFAISPNNSNTIYLAMRRVDSNGGSQPGLYKSTDGGANWTNAYTAPYDATTLRDIRVTVTPANPQRIYVYLGRRNPTAEVRVIVSNDGGANWTDKGGEGIDSGQFGYNTYIFADPSNADTVYVGARDVFKSTDGGGSWTNITKTFSSTFSYQPTSGLVHSDQHFLTFAPNNSNTIYVANDGGLYRSTDAGATFRSLNATLSLSQFVGIAIHPTDATITYGGTQDNGTQRRTRGASGAALTNNLWNEFQTGDGGRCVVNAADPSTVFVTYIYGSIYRYRSNGDSYDGVVGRNATFGEDESSPRIAFYPPFVGNGVDQKLYFGTWKLYISSDLGDNWSDPSGGKDLTKGGGDVLNAIGVARSNTNVIYTGSVQGAAMVSQDGGKNWTEITNGLPDRSITSITVDSTNPAIAYLTVSGYGTGHVFKTTNYGAAWTDTSSNLPNIPTSAFLIDPSSAQTLYAGTDIGIFRSTDGGGSWANFSNGMPPVVIMALVAQTAQNGGRIQAGTYGRGIYELVSGASATQFAAPNYFVRKDAGSVQITVTRTGDASVAGTIDYATSNDTANSASNYIAALGTLRFAAGETQKSFTIFITNNGYVEGNKTFNVTLSNPTGGVILGGPASATVTILETNATPSAANPIDDPTFYVRQHYVDFLNRDADQAGLAFWVGQINSCNGDASCIDIKRQNVSAAYFLSVEFQQTGYLVYRLYKAAYGRVLRLSEFTPDTQEIGRGVVVGQNGWEQLLENNKATFAGNFVARDAFKRAYPDSMSAADYVNALNKNTGNVLSADQVSAFIGGLNAGAETRATVLRKIAESDAFTKQEFNAAFVLMQYFGYLRRNPDDPPDNNLAGYNFWLKKLNDFNGNYITAEMVRSFILSDEYRKRFGKP
jgi:photosystem II stability/assembly factor-like uncharacterized protein